MKQANPRLRRLLADQLGECFDADIDRRLAELESFYASIPESYDDDLRSLKTLGTDTRYRIVRLLIAAEAELCVCEITPLLDVSESAISHALSDLMNAGLVKRRKDGTWHYYTATERAESLVESLDTTRRGTP